MLWCWIETLLLPVFAFQNFYVNEQNKGLKEVVNPKHFSSSKYRKVGTTATSTKASITKQKLAPELANYFRYIVHQ